MRITLQEWKSTEFPRGEFDSFAREIHENYSEYVSVIHPSFDHEWLLQAKGYVGYLPFSGGVIEIVPKVPVSNLFGMLDVAYGLKSFKVLDDSVEMSSLADFYSRLASILSHRVLARSRRGLFSTYRAENESLAFIRGRIDVRESLRSPLDPSISCHYEEHTTDVVENRLILYTLSTILQSGLCGEKYLPVVRHAYRVLSRFSSHEPFSWTDCMGRLYNRLNEDYEPMHGLCRFFLERMGPCQGRGERKMLPFVISMHQLFEEFVAVWLARKLKEDGRFSLSIQYSIEAGSFNIRPDLVVEDSQIRIPVLVADTKYKASDTIDQDDVYQVVAYAQKLSCSEAVLIYPFRSDNSYSYDWNGILTRTVAFDLQQSLDAAGEVFLRDLFGESFNDSLFAEEAVLREEK